MSSVKTAIANQAKDINQYENIKNKSHEVQCQYILQPPGSQNRAHPKTRKNQNPEYISGKIHSEKN
jgi:hypothetical protein